jgi:hypothetical protein
MPLRNDQEKLNQLNKQLLEAVQLSGNAFLSSTTVNGAFCLRACVIKGRQVLLAMLAPAVLGVARPRNLRAEV